MSHVLLEMQQLILLLLVNFQNVIIDEGRLSTAIILHI